MTTHYSQYEADNLRAKAQARGDVLDLYACDDGILRTAEDKAKHDRKASPHWLDAPIEFRYER